MTCAKTEISYSASNHCNSIDYVEVHGCRACGTEAPTDFLDLGRVPLANQLLIDSKRSRKDARVPLSVFFCNNCYLVQLRQTVATTILFTEYPYFSSFSDTMLESARRLTDRVTAERKLDGSSLVIEIGSNDGYLLKNYKERGIPVLGIEPAANIAAVAERQGINTICGFFNLKLAGELASSGKKADVLHGNNVIAHIPNAVENFESIARVLKDDGCAIIEVPYIRPLLDNAEFDTIYHEHVFYFSLSALDYLARTAGLLILDVEELPIHGGSLRVTMGHKGERSTRVTELLKKEASWPVSSVSTYNRLPKKIESLKTQLRSLLESLRQSGKSLAAYGASAKGTTLLSVFDIGSFFSFVSDRSTAKQGCLTPGTHLKIHSPDKLLEGKIDFTLLLVWNFAEEVVEQQIDYMKSGGSFIVPFPKLSMASWNSSAERVEWKIL